MTYELKSLNKFIETYKTNPNAGICKQRDELEKNLQNINTLNNLKNCSLYTSINNNKFVRPSQIIDINTLTTIEHNAYSKLMLTKVNCIRVLKEKKLPNNINLSELEKLKLYKFQ